MRAVREISFGERIASAIVGAVFGAVFGAVLVWLFGVYSQSMGPGRFVPDIVRWIMGCSAAFAILGLAIGSHVGTAIGVAFSAIYEIERQRSEDPEVPTWLAVVLVVAVALGVYWWVSN